MVNHGISPRTLSGLKIEEGSPSELWPQENLGPLKFTLPFPADFFRDITDW